MSGPAEGHGNPAREERIDAVLRQYGLDVFPEDVRTEVEELLSRGQAVEPETRDRFVAAAGRGVRSLATAYQSPLETLLFRQRRDRSLDAEDLVVAARLDIDSSTIRGIERGEVELVAVAPRTVAAWALSLDVDRLTLARALRRSLVAATTTASYTGLEDVTLDTSQEEFVNEVMGAFDQLVTDELA